VGFQFIVLFAILSLVFLYILAHFKQHRLELQLNSSSPNLVYFIYFCHFCFFGCAAWARRSYLLSTQYPAHETSQ